MSSGNERPFCHLGLNVLTKQVEHVSQSYHDFHQLDLLSDQSISPYSDHNPATQTIDLTLP